MQVHTKTGEHFVLERTVNRGGEAQIWSVQGEPHLVAKLYHKPTAEHEAKLAAMIGNPPARAGAHPAVAWPLHQLYQQQNFVGFLMPHVVGARPLFHVYNPARRRRLAQAHRWPTFLHRTARNLAAAVELVHARGHVIGDLNESNVLVNSQALVTLVDTDSFQIQAGGTRPNQLSQWLGSLPSSQIYRSVVGKAEFTPPELQGVDFKQIDRTQNHDYFALGVLLFYLLMDGFHPFAGRLTSALSMARVDLHSLKQGLFPYAHNDQIEPPPGAPPLRVLHPQVQEAFYRCFVDGYLEPKLRPTAREWGAIMKSAEAALVNCTQDTGHVYTNHLRQCPFCTPLPPSPLPKRRPPLTAARLWALILAFLAKDWVGIGQQHIQQPVLRWGSEIHKRLQPLWTQRHDYQGRLQRSWARLPTQWTIIHRQLFAHGDLWSRWVMGNCIGVSVAGLLAGGALTVSRKVPAAAMLTADELTLLLLVIFGLTLGSIQAQALRHSLLNWVYLRVAWIGATGLAGLVTAGIGNGLWGQGWLRLDSAANDLPILIIGTLFGVIAGFFQALLLRQQMRLADDGRLWTVANGVAGMVIAQGWLWGREWLLFPEVDWRVNAMIGVLIGAGLAAMGTGALLLWLVQGPKRAFRFHQVAFSVLRWRLASQHVRKGALRWSRALLLLVIMFLLLQGIFQLSGFGLHFSLPPLPDWSTPRLAPPA
ncbi:MAG: hypothetical protein R3C14_13055 [Caldilineaceae bacterium]